MAALTCVSSTSAHSGTWPFRPAAPSFPLAIAHIAPDPLEPAFDDDRFAARLRTKRTGIKRALLDQSLISGVGNIYADESLWRARLHWARATDALRRGEVLGLLAAIRAVFGEAIQAGGTSFDSLYVQVNGQSGYFDRSLAVYGREGEPCPRCGAPVHAREVHEQVLLPVSPLPAQATARALVTSHDDWDVEPVSP